MNVENYKVLLVDDEPDILEFISYNMQKEGFQVLTATNGQEAIKVAQAEIPELIILDVMMPEMDGIETCEELKKIPSLKNSIVAFLTARGEDYSQIAGFDAGADDYITSQLNQRFLFHVLKPC
jgi:two-component system alkaline phosphatase synthesis response regulator PhoP